jgi:hypothetical protein
MRMTGKEPPKDEEYAGEDDNPMPSEKKAGK